MANAIHVDAWRSISSASITTSYQDLGTEFGRPARLVHFINGTNGDVAVSFDGTTNNIPVLAGSFVIYDTTTNEDTNESIRWSSSTQAEVKWISAPGSPTGTFYLVILYSQGQ